MRALFFFLCLPLFAASQAVYPFIENGNQWPSHVFGKFDLPQGDLYLETGALTYHFTDYSEVSERHANFETFSSPPVVKSHVYKVCFRDALFASFTPESELPTTYNYFLGADESKWSGGVKSYRGGWYQNIYEGVDLHFYGKDYALKYDFIVAPGADPSQIALDYSGMSDLYLDNGRLVCELTTNQVIEQAPIAYQTINGQDKRVACKYVLDGHTVRFAFDKGYDPNFPLVIDPELLFSTYSGSFSDNFGFTAAYDDEGFLYSGSSAFGQGYPTTVGAYQTVWGGGDGQGTLAGTDIALSKYDTTGTFMVYSTFIGGENDELPHSLIVNAAGELIMYGTTSSTNFPVTDGAFSEVFQGGSNVAPEGVGVQYVNGSDIVISKFSASGANLIGSTFVGGSGNDGVNTSDDLKFNYADEFRGEVELDAEGNIYVASCSFSTDFPIQGGIQGTNQGDLDGVIFKMNPGLTTMEWSTFYGESAADACYSLALKSNGNLVVCGGTTSQGLAGMENGVQSGNNGGRADGFIITLQEDGNGLINGTYWGSDSYDQCYFVELDDLENVHIYGQTMDSGTTFIQNAAYNSPNSGMLVSKFNSDLDEVIWTTVFGTGSGEPNLSPTAFLVDVCGKIYLSGWGGSTNTNSNPDTDNVFGMDTTDDAYQQDTNGSDFYLLVMESDASALVFASYFGGLTSSEHVDGGTSRFNRKGEIYQSVCAGCGSNDDFPIFPSNAHSPTNNSSNCNNGVFKFDFSLPISVADFNFPPIGCVNEPIDFVNSSAGFQTVEWDFGDNETSGATNPSHLYDSPGSYDITLIVSSTETCNFTDTLTKTINIAFPQSSNQDQVSICDGESVTIGPSDVNPDYNYTWSPAESLDAPNEATTQASPEENTAYLLLIDTGACVDTLRQFVEVENLELIVSDDIVLCDDSLFEFIAEATPTATYTWSENPGLSPVLNTDPSSGVLQIELNEDATYYVQAETEFCTKLDSVQVDFISEQSLIGGDLTACFGDTITLEVLNPNPLLSYSWSPEELILNGQNTPSIQAVVNENQAFVVFADDGNGCVSEDDIFVSVSGLNAQNISATATPANISVGGSSQLEVLPDGYEYSWSPAFSLDDSGSQTPIATPEETTQYDVSVIDGECIQNTSVLVRVFDFECGPASLFLPNAFSPNGDGENDVLFVRGDNITNLDLQIFNRWGEKIFETKSQRIGWDGNYNGKQVDPAVFVYHLTIDCGGGPSYFEKGNITLIR